MSRAVLLLLCVLPVRPAVFPPRPSLASQLDTLFNKLERITLAPQHFGFRDRISAQVDKLNSLGPEEVELTEDDVELLSTMQQWTRLTPTQVATIARDLQMKHVEEQDDYEGEEAYVDGDPPDNAESDYAMDADWETEEEATTRPPAPPALPTAAPPRAAESLDFRKYSFLAAVNPLAATNERPRILDDSSMTPAERFELRQAALANIGAVVHAGRCLTPQPRWLAVRQLAPAANTVYMPPCVQLHRCAPDAGCCYSEDEVCAPIEGKHVAIPLYLHRADGVMAVSRMLFYNHTRCGCLSREHLAKLDYTKVQHQYIDLPKTKHVEAKERINNQRLDKTTEAPGDELEISEWKSDVEPIQRSKDDLSTTTMSTTKDAVKDKEMDEEPTAPPQMRKCTCPGLFKARVVNDTICTCVCESDESARRPECFSLARGREHFGLRDRVCVARGACTPPTCDYGTYDVDAGRCPARKVRRARYRKIGKASRLT